MNLDRLNKLNDLLDECDSRIKSYLENAITAGKLNFYAIEIASMQHVDNTRAAKLRILEAIRKEMNILRTQNLIEIEHENNA